MSDENIQKYRILIIDDNVDIHEDFKKILSSRCGSYLKFNQESEFELEALEEELFKIKKKKTTCLFLNLILPNKAKRD